MACIKTGAWLYLAEYGEHVYGDLHTVGNTLIGRVNTDSETLGLPQGTLMWATMWTVDQRFNNDQFNTVISANFKVHWRIAQTEDLEWITIPLP
jgi:hypothetical protein